MKTFTTTKRTLRELNDPTMPREPVCGHCGAIKDDHRGIDLYCPDQFATTFWESPGDKLSRIDATINNLCEEIEKLKSNITK
jgi:hypothetical protein